MSFFKDIWPPNKNIPLSHTKKWSAGFAVSLTASLWDTFNRHYWKPTTLNSEQTEHWYAEYFNSSISIEDTMRPLVVHIQHECLLTSLTERSLTSDLLPLSGRVVNWIRKTWLASHWPSDLRPIDCRTGPGWADWSEPTWRASILVKHGPGNAAKSGKTRWSDDEVWFRLVERR